MLCLPATASGPPVHNAVFATSAGQFQDAIDIARAATTDPVAAEPTSLARMLVPPLALIGEFDEALHHADAMWHAWQTSGRPTAGGLWFPTPPPPWHQG